MSSTPGECASRLRLTHHLYSTDAMAITLKKPARAIFSIGLPNAMAFSFVSHLKSVKRCTMGGDRPYAASDPHRPDKRPQCLRTEVIDWIFRARGILGQERTSEGRHRASSLCKLASFSDQIISIVARVWSLSPVGRQIPSSYYSYQITVYGSHCPHVVDLESSVHTP